MIGVKAKQSSTPTQTPTLNNNVNNLKLINQSSFNMAHPSQSGFIINQSKPNMSSSQSMPLINTNMEANGAFAIRPNNPSLIQPQANMLNHPPPNHNMSSLLPTPLLTSTLLIYLKIRSSIINRRFRIFIFFSLFLFY